MDFITSFLRSDGLDSMMVLVDRLSKYTHFVALGHPFTAKDMAKLFLKEIVHLHGFPKELIFDWDQIFLSQFWSELSHRVSAKLKYSTAYHPQMDGQIEVVNCCLETYLLCFVGSKPKPWPEWLRWAEYWFNMTFNASTKMTPF